MRSAEEDKWVINGEDYGQAKWGRNEDGWRKEQIFGYRTLTSPYTLLSLIIFFFQFVVLFRVPPFLRAGLLRYSLLKTRDPATRRRKLHFGGTLADLPGLLCVLFLLYFFLLLNFFFLVWFAGQRSKRKKNTHTANKCTPSSDERIERKEKHEACWKVLASLRPCSF